MQCSQYVTSNDLGKLAEVLVSQLFIPGQPPFERRIVVVPSDRIKMFLQRFFAQHPQLNIAMGVEFLSLGIVLQELCTATFGKKLPSRLELELSIFHVATDLLAKRTKDLEPLEEYVDGDRDKLRIIARQMSQVFLDYGSCAWEELPEWLHKKGWQQRLWHELFADQWTYPIELFGRSSFLHRMHVFGFSYLPLPHVDFFVRSGAVFYLFSPCQLYWGDLKSDREQARLQRHLSPRVAEEFAGYFDEQNPLLANWGKAGRLFTQMLEDREVISSEEYIEPEGDSTLQGLQRSMLMMEKSCSCCVEKDDSIWILAAPSRFREVESLLDRLQELFVRHANDERPISPGDVLVLAPDIREYAPYVHALFARKEANLPYAISGLEIGWQSPFAMSFLSLLDIVDRRFERDAMLELFHQPSFLAKRGWDEGDLRLIKQWTEIAGIHWGLDRKTGSWRFGLDRLIFGLVLQEGELIEKIPSPLDALDGSELGLLNELIEVITNLEDDFKQVMEKTQAKLSDWIHWVVSLGKRYLEMEENDRWLFKKLEELNEQLLGFSKAPNLAFEDLKRIIQSFFEERKGSYRTHDLQAIYFDSIREGAILPKRVICLLGLQDGAFPRPEPRSSLHLLDERPLAKGHLDRYHFLEACSMASSYLCMSYLEICPQEKVELMPSLVVQELIDFFRNPMLDSEANFEKGRMGAMEISKGAFIQKAPPLSFQVELLNKKPYFSPSRYEAAQSFYAKKQSSYFGSEAIFATGSPDFPEHWEVDIGSLNRAVRHPLQFHLEEVLHFSLDQRESYDPLHLEELELSALDRAIFSREMIGKSWDESIAELQSRGVLPIGIGKELSLKKLAEDQASLDEQMHHFSLEKQDLWTIILDRFCDAAQIRGERTLLVPPWILSTGEGRTVTVTGRLHLVSMKGMLCFARKDLAKLLRFWPSLLVLAGHPELREFPPIMLLAYPGTKGATLDFTDIRVDQLVLELLRYYLLAQETPIPLTSRLAAHLLSKGEEGLQQEMQKEEDLYWRWLQDRDALLSAQTLMRAWQPLLQCTFAPLVNQVL